MSHHVNKLYWILLLVMVSSCYPEPSSKDLRQRREKAYQVSISIIGQKEYWNIYNAMNDSVKAWAENELQFYEYFNRDSVDFGVEYQIDSLICFNAEKNMCFTGILRQITDKEAVMDDISHFFGIKINEKWYFFDGETLILPREYYQKNIHTPLSFEKLKELAMRHLYYNYIRRSKINDAFFEPYYKYDADNIPCTNKAKRESSWLKQCGENWSLKNKR